jgi:periplasmic protein TonB
MRLALASSLFIHVLGVGLVSQLRAPHASDVVSAEMVVQVELIQHELAGPSPASSDAPASPARLAAVPSPRDRKPARKSPSLTEPKNAETASPKPLVEEPQVPSTVAVQAAPQLVEPSILAKEVPLPSARTTSAHPSAPPPVEPMRWEKIGQAVRRQVVYPPLARRRGIQGRAMVRFTVDSSGAPSDVRIVESSGYAILDEAASDAVVRAAPLPPVTPSTQVVVPIVFALH